MIGDSAVVVATGDAGVDDVLERLAAVTPGRMHLQIAAVRGELRTAELRIAQRRHNLRARQKVAAQVAAFRDVRAVAAGSNRAVHSLGSTGAQHFENYARG